MAINTQTIRIDLNTGRTIPVAFAHQNDTNRQLTFQLYNNGVAFTPSSTTVKFAYKSPIVNGRYSVITGSQMASGTVSGSTVTVTLPAAYTQVSGVGLLTMILTTSGNTLRPVNIKFVCQGSADGDDTVLGASDWPEGLYDYMDNWLEENEPTEIANLKSDLSGTIETLTTEPIINETASANAIINKSFDFEPGLYNVHATGNNIAIRFYKEEPFNVNEPSNIVVASNYTAGELDTNVSVPEGYHFYRFYSGTTSGSIAVSKVGQRLDNIENEIKTKTPKHYTKTLYANDILRGSFASSTGIFTPSTTGSNYGTDYLECYENAPIQYVRNTATLQNAWYLRFYYYDATMAFVGTSESSFNMANTYIATDTAPSRAAYARIALAYVSDLNYLAVPFTLNVGLVYEERTDFSYDKSVITFAAFDSTVADKMTADIVCDGINDEVELQHAVDMLQANNRRNGGKIILLNGTYIIGSLYDSENADIGKVGILLKNNLAYSQYGSITIEGANLPNLKSNMQAGSCAVIQLSDECFNSLTTTEKVSIIGGLPAIENNVPTYKACAGSWLFKNFAVAIQNPYKSIIGINAEWCWSLQMSNIQFARTTNVGRSQLAHEIYNANDGCIGLRTLRVLNNGSGFQIENVNVRGWGTGFDIAGEHMTMIGCAARINKTGYRFGYFDSCGHPNVLINCCDEVCINGIKLYGGALHPTLEFISYNRELDNWEYESDPTEKIVYQSLAWEEYPGNYYGRVTYAVNSAWNYINQANQSFWDDGSGIHFDTKNLMDKMSGTTAERPSVPQINQMYFDTTINKAIWYIDNHWVDATGTVV